MKSWVLCTASLLLFSNAMAQSQGQRPPVDPQNGPPPGYQDQQDNGPPPGYEDQQDNGPPPGYEDQQGNGPPPGYQDQQGNGPPPGYQDNGPAAGYPDRGPPPGYQDNQPPSGYDDQQGDEPPQGYQGPPPGYQYPQGGRQPGANGSSGRPSNGAPPPNQQGTTNRKRNENFGGWVLVTSDANWQAKWETPSNTMPTFTAVHDLDRGKKVYALIFFANPQLDTSGQAHVSCDIEMTRPDGSLSKRQSNVNCFSGKLEGDSHETYLANPVVGFVGDPGDQAGMWRIKVTLRDDVRHASVPLQASFSLKK